LGDRQKNTKRTDKHAKAKNKNLPLRGRRWGRQENPSKHQNIKVGDLEKSQKRASDEQPQENEKTQLF
jgi:hypothetical protein